MALQPNYRPKRRVSNTASLSAPVGGWNARDSLADMNPNDAVILTNWFPSTNEVTLRKGHSRFATGFSGQVETVMSYNSGVIDELFAVDNGNVYNITAGGAIPAADLSGLTNDRLEYINVTTPGGSYLYFVNATDLPYTYDGTTWANPAITGVDETTLNSINLHKNRIWFTQENTLEAWYLGTASIAGAANLFDLSSVAQMGGYLVASATWTIDAGYGVDDIMVFITSEGEVILYRGTDPATAADWLLVGIFRIGSPVGGARCWLKYAGDLLVITKDGVVPLSGALQSSRTNPKVAVTDKIQAATNTSIASYGSNFGWQLIDYPLGNMLILNVPTQEGADQEQYVMNTITKAWCNFSGWDANCWTLFNDQPYFGSNGFVGLAWNTNADNGNNIDADALQAFNYFQERGTLKRYTMARPIFRTNGNPAVNININLDFDTTDTSSAVSFTPTVYSTWDVALWDVGVWGGGLSVLKNWQGVNGVGYSAGIRLTTASSGIELTWVSTDLVFEAGEVL
jgi:hypothetical protein